ncbi:MAG: hypothetical protein KIT09_04415 [Bryobacteraceae bacterium]|nr:hypothetical protein [Bryobacteraceae bacterium]
MWTGYVQSAEGSTKNGVDDGDNYQPEGLEAAGVNPRLSRRTGRTPAVSIRIDPADLARARTQAARKGIRYQTYLKMLLHEALEREEMRAGG